MEQKILPVTVTTDCALRKCVTDETPLIYIHSDLYKDNSTQINDYMRKNGYIFEILTSKGGLFYAKGIDIRQYIIDDPTDFY